MISQFEQLMPDGRVAKIVLLQGMPAGEADITAGVEREADPEWRYTDRAGHRHDAGLATLEWVMTGSCGCSHCTEPGAVGKTWGEWRCRECRQPVLPGTRLKQAPRPVAEVVGTVVYGGCLYKLTPAEVAALRNSSDIGQWALQVTGRPADGLASL